MCFLELLIVCVKYITDVLLSVYLMLDKDLNYDNLAAGLKATLENDKSAFDADLLQKYTGNLIFQTFLFNW